MQQINLFNPDFVPRRDLASLPYLAAGVFAVLVLSLGGMLMARMYTGNLAQEELRLNQAVKDLRTQTETLSAQLGARQVDATLQAELAALRVRLQGRQQIMRWLKTQGVETGGGTSEYLRALARRTIDGVWITGFYWSQQGDRLRLEGRALDGDLVPRYLTGLGAEAALQGRAFTRVAVDGAPASSNATEPAVLTFRLETGEPGGDRRP